ncbi:hypothetical protein ACRBEV_06230 [Methylobacterium phyllosphaerae]
MSFPKTPRRATSRATGTRTMATTETRATFARRHGVNRSTVGRWEAKGSIVLTVDGLVNVEASEQLLGGRAETHRGGKAKGPSAQKVSAKVDPVLDALPAQDPLALAHAGLAEVIRAIGPYAARMALEFGAPLEVAYGLDQAVAVKADVIAARFRPAPRLMRSGPTLGSDVPPVRWRATIRTPCSARWWIILRRPRKLGEP